MYRIASRQVSRMRSARADFPCRVVPPFHLQQQGFVRVASWRYFSSLVCCFVLVQRNVAA
jgi:hypothetical protein